MPDTVMALMYTAKKYAIQTLVNKCRDYLQTGINSDNVCTILEQAHVFDEHKLRDHCFTTVFANTNEVMKGPLKDYQNLCYECLKKLLESDKLRAKEETILSACLNWAEEQCRIKQMDVNDTNLRAVLGDILFLIRFPNMKPRVFTELVSKRNLLTAEEKLAVYQQFSRSPRDGDITAADGFKFLSRPRNSTELFRATRFQEILGGTFDFWDNDNLCDAISFMSSRDINLFGVTIFRPFQDGLVRGCIKLYDESYWCMTKQDHLEIVYAENNKTMDIKFKGSVKIQQNRWYTVTQEMSGSKSYFGMKGQRQVQGKGVLISFRNSPMDKNNTNVDSGQITGLLYS